MQLMEREELFDIWVPPGGTWSLWARPVLFAQMPPFSGQVPGDEAWRSSDVEWAPDAAYRRVLVVDLPDAESVWLGLALAGRGYRPVPLFNACTGPHEMISQQAIIDDKV